MDLEITIQKRKNKMALIVWSITISVLAVAYMVEVIKGLRTISYVVGLMALPVIPLIISWVLFAKNNANKIISYICMISYIVFYTFVIFDSPYGVTSIYIYPMLGIAYLYEDMKLVIVSTVMSVSSIVSKIACSIFMEGKAQPKDITEYEVEFFGLLLFCIFMIMIVSKIRQNNNERRAIIENHMIEAQNTTETILATSKNISEHVGQVKEAALNQERCATEMSQSMAEMSQAVSEVANRLENQQYEAKVIQEKVEGIAAASNQMVSASLLVKQTVKVNNDNLLKTQQDSIRAKETSVVLEDEMKSLLDKAQEMEGIVTIIQEITENTNLLALNASIEAARAGEAGKGFAVVAEQIRKLADDTQKSAIEITELLGEFQNISGNVKDGIADIADIVIQQNESVEKTCTEFKQMGAQLDELNSQTEHIKEEMDLLSDANVKITDAITEISTVTQEMSVSIRSVEELSVENEENGAKTEEGIANIANEIEQLVK